MTPKRRVPAQEFLLLLVQLQNSSTLKQHGDVSMLAFEPVLCHLAHFTMHENVFWVCLHLLCGDGQQSSTAIADGGPRGTASEVELPPHY